MVLVVTCKGFIKIDLPIVIGLIADVQESL